MASTKITINGQQYDSPDAMPPDVRRTYDEAMRMLGSTLASGSSSGNTQVFTGQAGQVGGSVVVNRVVAVNDRTYGSVDELPPEMRQQYENAIQGMAPQVTPKTSVHVSLNMSGSKGSKTPNGSSKSRAPNLEPIDSSLEARIRDIPISLAFLIVIGLVLWAVLGRR